MIERRILDLVIADLHGRDAKGLETYGSTLRASSTNDALWYAYEEILDAAMYLRQEIERRGSCRCGAALSERRIHSEEGARVEMVCLACENDSLTRLARSVGR